MTNDRDALVEELAEEMWNRHRDRTMDPDRWKDAGPYWHMVIRDFAQATLKMLETGHG